MPVRVLSETITIQDWDWGLFIAQMAKGLCMGR